MAVSYSSQCSTDDDYACNKEIYVFSTKEKLWEYLKAFFNNPDERKKFMKGYKVSQREKDMQDNATLVVVKKTLLIRKRCEEKYIFGKEAEVAVLYTSNFSNAEMAKELMVTENCIEKHLAAICIILGIKDEINMIPLLRF